MDSNKIDGSNIIFNIKVINPEFINNTCIACSNDTCQSLISLCSIVEYTMDDQNLSEVELKSIFQWLISNEIVNDSGFPNAMCPTCVQHLLGCFSFRLTSLNSVSKLQEQRNAQNLENTSNITDLNISFRSESEMLFLSNFDEEKQNSIINSILDGSGITSMYDIDKDFNAELLNCDQPLVDSNNIKESEKSESQINISKQFICNICGKQFKNNTTFKRHLVRHSSKKMFQCKHCGKEFFHKGELSKHMITHEKKPNHVCDICGANFSRLDTLAVHKKIHLNIKPHCCSYCPKKFLNAYNLQNHIRTHSKDKPFVCAYCSKGFTQRTSLIYHIDKLHSNGSDNMQRKPKRKKIQKSKTND